MDFDESIDVLENQWLGYFCAKRQMIVFYAPKSMKLIFPGG